MTQDSGGPRTLEDPASFKNENNTKPVVVSKEHVLS